jgi:hypothetical protein
VLYTVAGQKKSEDADTKKKGKNSRALTFWGGQTNKKTSKLSSICTNYSNKYIGKFKLSNGHTDDRTCVIPTTEVHARFIFLSWQPLITCQGGQRQHKPRHKRHATPESTIVQCARC